MAIAWRRKRSQWATDILLFVLVKRIRIIQKINKISGSTVRTRYRGVLNKVGDRCCPIPTAESNLIGRFAPPRKKDPAAINSPKHIRQRCRVIRWVSKRPTRKSMRMSPAAASSITEPMKKVIPTGTPFCELAPIRTTLIPFSQVRIPSTNGIKSTTQSNQPVSPFLRLAVSHAVPIK